MSQDPSGPELLADKNKMYDNAAGALWHLAVYDPVHNGREFTNMAGAALLDSFGAEFSIDAGDQVLELCSGTGEVCRYLAGRFQCSITGVELNSGQLRHARLRQRKQQDEVRKRVRYLQGDVTTWLPDRPYDLVLALDSLALLTSPIDALAMAHAALRPGGHLAFADILAGQALTERVRVKTWEYDGIRPLGPPEQTTAMLAGLGFRHIACADITEAAVDCFRVISGALALNRRAIQDISGSAEYRHWCESAEFYVESFTDRELTYWRFAAEKPAEEPEGEIR